MSEPIWRAVPLSLIRESAHILFLFNDLLQRVDIFIIFFVIEFFHVLHGWLLVTLNQPNKSLGNIYEILNHTHSICVWYDMSILL